jgi:hypothetical protein
MRDPDPLIRRLQRNAAIWCGLVTVGALVLRPHQPGIAAGVAGGGLLALGSLFAIRASADALLARAGAGLAVKLAGRYALLALGAYVMIVRLRLHPIGVLIGASSLVAAASFEAVRVLRRS